MKRRLFLQLPLVASFLSAQAQSTSERPKKGIKVEADKDRFSEELFFMGGRFDCKVSAKDTENNLCIYDTVRWEKGGPALHLHHSQDEWWYVITGEFIFKVGDEMFNLKPGDSLFAPRNIPHAFANTSKGEARILVLLQPAGTIETFFKEISKLNRSDPNFSVTSRNLTKQHGIEVVGPPLRVD